MKVVAFNGSQRADGNTSILIKQVFAELEKEGIETELVSLAGEKIRGCLACYKCFENKDQECSQKKDIVNECIQKMIEADGIIMGCGTYFVNVSAELKALIDRAGLVAIANGHALKRKLGAAVVAQRRCGGYHVFSSINAFFTINQMIIPGSSYWNLGVGLQKGDVEQDEEAAMTMKNLGENMAWLLKKVND